MTKTGKPAKKVKTGDNATVEYVGKTAEGSVFDKGRLEFEVGAGEMIAGFDSGVLGMTEGQVKTITIKPKDGYGQRDDNLMMEIPMQEFKRNNIKPVKGAMFTIEGQQGRIVSVRDTGVTIDFNHFLAGKILVFKVKLLKIR